MSQYENNPYVAPVGNVGTNPMHGLPPQSNGMVSQIKAVAIVMMVLGSLEILMGIFYTSMAFIFPQIMAMQQAQQNVPASQLEQLKFMEQIMFWYYGGAGVLTIVGGILRIIAGISNLSYRRRSLAVFSHFFGLLNFLTCYCAPFSVGMCIWDCIVHFNAAVKQAFQMRAEGQSVEQINQHFHIR